MECAVWDGSGGFNGAAALTLRKLAWDERVLAVRKKLQWGRSVNAAETKAVVVVLMGSPGASMGPQR